MRAIDVALSLPLQSSLMSETYLKSDHFNGGGSTPPAGLFPVPRFRHHALGRCTATGSAGHVPGGVRRDVAGFRSRPLRMKNYVTGATGKISGAVERSHVCGADVGFPNVRAANAAGVEFWPFPRRRHGFEARRPRQWTQWV